MGRDANGTFTRVHNWVTDKNNSVKITASRFDAENDDFASALTASGEIVKIINGSYQALNTVVETTAQNSISATPHTAITSYTTNECHWWIPGFNNTGAATLTISGLSAASVLAGGAAMVSGMFLSGVPVMVISDGSGFHCMNPQRSPADFVSTAGVQDNAITLAKWNHETVQGAIVYTDASGTPTYLAPGSSGEVLTSGGASANPSWAAQGVADNAITLAKMAHDVQGTIIYMGASGTPSYLAPGTSGYFLKAGGASANIAWSNTLGAMTLSGQITGADQTISAINLKDYGEITNAIGSIGGGTQDINLTLGNSVTATVDTSTTTFTFSNPTASDEGCSFDLFLTNGGSQTVNWPASVDWAGGTAPTLTTSGVDWLVFATKDGGTIWNGAVVGLGMS